MYKNYKLSDGSVHQIKMEEYPDDEFVVASMDFLGTNPNSHGLYFEEEKFINGCKSVLGKFVVAEIIMGDATTHTQQEVIVGSIPKEQEVKFTRNGAGYLRASVDVVLSKIYASDCCYIFVNDNYRSVSVEMKCYLNETDNSFVEDFCIFGVTILGKQTNPSSPGSNIQITRFSEEKADKFYHNKFSEVDKLQQFVANTKKQMEESKTYKINKTELKDGAWGDVDKTALRNKVMNAKNRASLVRSVYALVESGWEEAPSEHLKYPIMQEIDGTFYYNKHALSSALGYAKQEGEQSVITKINALYKKFNLDEESEKKEEMAKMDKDKQATDMAEEKNLNDSVKMEESNTDSKEKLAEETSSKEDTKEETKEENKEEMSCGSSDESMSETEESLSDLTAKLKATEDVVMAQKKELEELREFKTSFEERETASIVNATLARIKGRVGEEAYKKYEASGKECKFADVNAWKNGILAEIGESVLNLSENESAETIMRMEIPKAETNKSLWDRL